MNVSQTIAKLVDNGSIVSREVTFRSQVKPKAASKDHKLEKLVIGRYNIGQEYQPESVDGDSDGSADPRSLPWGEWVSYPFLIRHRDSNYLRLTPDSDDRPHVAFIVDGEKVTREEFAEHLTPANASKLLEGSNRPECITVKEENIVSIL